MYDVYPFISLRLLVLSVFTAVSFLPYCSDPVATYPLPTNTTNPCTTTSTLPGVLCEAQLSNIQHNASESGESHPSVGIDAL